MMPMLAMLTMPYIRLVTATSVEFAGNVFCYLSDVDSKFEHNTVTPPVATHRMEQAMIPTSLPAVTGPD